jgi:hypothetical protein
MSSTEELLANRAVSEGALLNTELISMSRRWALVVWLSFCWALFAECGVQGTVRLPLVSSSEHSRAVVQVQSKDSARSELAFIRGGAVKATSKKGSKWKIPRLAKARSDDTVGKGIKFLKPSTLAKLRDGFQSIKPVTRGYISVILVTATLHMLVGPSIARSFSLNIRSLFQVWRVLTSATYLGGPSLSLANNIFFLVTYGQLVEAHQGTPDFAYFLLVEMGLLSLFSLLLGFPFTSQSMMSSIIYVASRINAMDAV